eukprot:CAMPEP_0174729408 /NCGR_PEP_ID=MMETSP1094-20130205/53665_1 /TAXON_ID=156173 /ORGANISM="Chrysochromulina brevifilum, Strain UTEX LB 985" /LENGTH=140 /DNA_ID=CAMNT_0015931511 /DNA_START=274 /DNA_END=693 /DNA_ORIENTATION=-
MRSHGLNLLMQRWWGSVPALRMVCVCQRQLAVEMRASTSNKMVATPCASELAVAAMGSRELERLTQRRWGGVMALCTVFASVQLACSRSANEGAKRDCRNAMSFQVAPARHTRRPVCGRGRALASRRPTKYACVATSRLC